MSIHIGERIRKRAKELRIGPTELGKMIHTSKQNVMGIYKRKSLDAEMLSKISKALDYDFFYHYQAQTSPPIFNGDITEYKKAKPLLTSPKGRDKYLEQIKQLQKAISEKENEIIGLQKKIIVLLERR